jgi:hypothetical protein
VILRFGFLYSATALTNKRTLRLCTENQTKSLLADE